MSKGNPEHIDVSVHQRLLNISRERKEDFNLILTRYVVERFLYRLSCSEYAEEFVLKGAMLMAIWLGQSHRPTRDLDLLGFGESSEEALTKIFEGICRVEVERDGLAFDPSSIAIEEIRGDQEYSGRRVKLIAKLGSARIRIQVDVGFGDVVTPKAKPVEYPVLLDFPAPRIQAYPKETLIAEKLQAMVALGMANSRMKDYYDIYVLSQTFSFDGHDLVNAITATFERRDTPIPGDIPLALSGEFAMSKDKVSQWKGFMNRSGLADLDVDLARVISELRGFLLEPLQAAASGHPFKHKWIHSRWE
jgi:predicted nucleotidyltransferase component of viral defense system